MYVSEVFVGDVRVDLSRCYVCVAEKRLHRAEVCTVTEKVGCERMAHNMRSNLPCNACNRCVALNDALDASRSEA